MYLNKNEINSQLVTSEIFFPFCCINLVPSQVPVSDIFSIFVLSFIPNSFHVRKAEQILGKGKRYDTDFGNILMALSPSLVVCKGRDQEMMWTMLQAKLFLKMLTFCRHFWVLSYTVFADTAGYLLVDLRSEMT